MLRNNNNNNKMSSSLLLFIVTIVTSSPLFDQQEEVVPEVRAVSFEREFDVMAGDDVTYDVVADYVIESQVAMGDMYANEQYFDYPLQQAEVDVIEPEEQLDFIALPATFKRYDLNGDGYVTALELSDATGTDLEDSAKPFRVADLNDDGLITEDELVTAPWVFDQIHHRHDNVMT